ncbi:MAG: hypothetical protein R2748_31450 [Bryobacterales bacterium]
MAARRFLQPLATNFDFSFAVQQAEQVEQECRFAGAVGPKQATVSPSKSKSTPRRGFHAIG